MISLGNLRKAIQRAQRLSPDELLRAVGRRGWATARGRAAEFAFRLEGLTGDAEARLPRAVPGSQSAREAVARIEARVGALPVPVERQPELLRTFARLFPDAAKALVDRADQACRGEWDLLGYGPVQLGVRPDWQRDFRSGVRWDVRRPARRQPIVRGDGSDIKVPWELSRLQQLPAVAHAYGLTGDARYPALVAEQLEGWIDDNPAGFGVNWTCAMDVALRAVSMSWAFELCRRAPGFSERLRAKVYFSLYAHARFIRGHLEDGGVVVGNHYVADLLGLVWIGSMYPALRGARGWREAGRARLIQQLRRQLRPDGGDDESSLPYHRLVAELIGLAGSVLRQNGRGAPELEDALRRMAVFTAGVLDPDGAAPQLGDNDSGRAFRLLPRPPNEQRYLLSWAALAAGDPALAALAPLDPEALLLVGPDAPQRHAALAPRPAEVKGPHCRAFLESGLCVLREGDFYLLLCATPVGQGGAGGHGHNDKLAFELQIAGPLIADPGSFVYTADPALRNQLRGTAAHATVQLDGREQNPVSSTDLFYLPERAHAAVRRFEAEGEGFVWEADHQGFAPLTHRRTVRAWPTRRVVRVEDRILGPSDGEHELVSRLPLAPGVTARIEGQTFRLERPGRPTVLITASGSSRPELAIEPGWYSEAYGAKSPCRVLRLGLRARLPARLDLEIAPA